MRVVLVGGGMSVLAGESGAFIDEADFVARVNVFSVKPEFQAHTGTKTDLWWVQSSSCKTVTAKKIKTLGVKTIAYVESVHIRRVVEPIATQSGVRLYEHPMVRFQELWERLVIKPSSGMVCFDFLQKECGYDFIYTIGIDGFTEKGAHYYDPSNMKPKQTGYTNAERGYIDEQIRLGRAKRLNEAI